MRIRMLVAGAAVSVGVAALVAWALGWSFERAALLAPVLVVTVAAVVGLAVLWGRIVWESIRPREHK